MCFEANSCTPESWCRITMNRAPIDSIVWSVSTSDSPLATLEAPISMLRTSSPRRWAARSKEARVRVEGSKKRYDSAPSPESSLSTGASDALIFNAVSISASRSRLVSGSIVRKWRARATGSPALCVCDVLSRVTSGGSSAIDAPLSSPRAGS